MNIRTAEGSSRDLTMGLARASYLFLFLLASTSILSAPAATIAGEKGLMEMNGTIKVGQTAPPIETTDLNGHEFSLNSFRGKPIFVDFGSVLCEACADMVLEMNRLKKKYSGTDLEIIMIVDGSMPTDTTKAFFSRLKANFTTIRDEEWTFFQAYGVTVVPFKVLIDRVGKIKSMHLGYDQSIEELMDFQGLLR